MFKKAKQKIVIYILTILCAILVGTLAMIYISSYLSARSQSYKVLEQRMEELIKNHAPGQMKAEEEKGLGDTVTKEDFSQGQGKIKRRMKVDRFYAVKFGLNGNCKVLENGADGLYSDEELVSFAEGVRDKEKGSIGDLLYIVRCEKGDTYVAFVDNTMFKDNYAKLFFFTLSFGMIAIIAITFMSVKIAGKIVSPMEETYEKQKQFTADAGHELKTPIAATSANIELLKREIGNNKWLENISYENERMRELVSELLELAKNENRAAQRKMTDLSRLVNGAILSMEASAFEKNILIESDISDGIMANVEEKAISQLVTILLDNAVSHTKISDGELGRVSVILIEKKGAAFLSVTNPGEEISEADKDKLFERFYRSDSSHEFTGHYGLGLAIAKAIADANAAKISVSCQNEMVTFSVVFSEKR